MCSFFLLPYHELPLGLFPRSDVQGTVYTFDLTTGVKAGTTVSLSLIPSTPLKVVRDGVIAFGTQNSTFHVVDLTTSDHVGCTLPGDVSMAPASYMDITYVRSTSGINVVNVTMLLATLTPPSPSPSPSPAGAPSPNASAVLYFDEDDFLPLTVASGCDNFGAFYSVSFERI